MGYNGLWKDDREKASYRTSYDSVDAFFENLYSHSNENNTIHMNSEHNMDYTGLCYREEQNAYALDVMEAIKNRQILLVQAGVGIGKSYGYLIPIFYTYQNVPKFNRVVIATSNIALQQQLLRDIDKISKMLGIEMKASIAKGINNYACLKRIESWIRSDRTPIEKKKQLENLVLKMEELCTSDKEDLKEFSEKIWKDVQLQSRGYCSNCAYSKRCPLYKEQVNLKTSNIIVTNYANLFRNVLDNSNWLKDTDMFVFDEAHQMEANMMNLNEKELSLKTIESVIDNVGQLITLKFSNSEIISLEQDYDMEENIETLKREIEKLFSFLRRSSSINFAMNNRNNHSIMDGNRLPFKYNSNIERQLNIIIQKFDLLFEDIKNYELKSNSVVRTKSYEKLKEIYSIFWDMSLQKGSRNIYWVNFFKENMIHLYYTPKKNKNISQAIFSKDIPIVCTSGTLLDNQNSYQYFRESIGLTEEKGMILGESYPSPFDYKENTLCYYNPNMASPNNYKDYVVGLATEIDQLIRATNGKSLILFTSKKCMNEVYHILSQEDYGFPLFLHNDNNTQEVKEQFTQDTNSCLFATGAFWEGIDIKGKSLSQVIVTHLPFDVVDAVMQYKASKYAGRKAQFQQVYIPSMLVKLEQAMGRLIRNNIDTGIVSFLDSRFENYLKLVKNNTGFPNYTTSLTDVVEFSSNKILTEDPTQEKKYTKVLN